MFAAAVSAQTDNSLYRFDNSGSPVVVTKLGAAPEFPFLRNMTTPHQVYMAIHRHANDHTASMNKLNDLLKQEGYANGAKDLQESDITMESIEPGTEGNMGSRGYTYKYTRLSGNPSEFRAWRIRANDNSNVNGSVYLLAKCGNAFFPKNTKTTACITVPVSVTPDMNQVSLPSSGNQVNVTNETFVYYTRKHHKKNEAAYPVSGISEMYPSRPVRINSQLDQNVNPETYTVTVNTPTKSVYACTDKPLELTANINLEKTSAYTGNYPSSDNRTYRKVSKHEYKMIARRMRRIERKENKIARRTGVPVDVSTATAKA